MLIIIIAIILCGYFIGCIHGSVLAQVLAGVNLKEIGTKNAGASNATIILGKKFGAMVALIDIGKGALAVIILKLLLDSTFSDEVVWTLLFIVGAAVIIGHIFPFYMKFKGGKGTASVIGVLLALDWRIGLVALLLFVVASLLSDYIIVGVLMLYLTMFVLSIWFTEGIWPIIISILLFLIAILKHIENIQRIRNHTEGKVSAVFKKKK